MSSKAPVNRVAEWQNHALINRRRHIASILLNRNFIASLNVDVYSRT